MTIISHRKQAEALDGYFRHISKQRTERRIANAAFLRAERKADGERTFKLIEGKPWQTSYGVEVYDKIFS